MYLAQPQILCNNLENLCNTTNSCFIYEYINLPDINWTNGICKSAIENISTHSL